MLVVAIDESAKKALVQPLPLTAAAPRLTATQVLLRQVTRMAALFHDIGKANVQFQRKLRGAREGGERVRHEFLSYLLLARWHDTLAQPLQWLDALESASRPLCSAAGADHTANIDPRLASLLSSSQGTGTHAELLALANTVVAQPLSADPLWGGLLWLVLTHHRLVGANAEDDYTKPTLLHAQLNDCPFDPDNLRLAKDDLPWDDSAWCEQVRACARQMQCVIADNPGLVERLTQNPHTWAATLATVCGPYLVFSDYTGSLLKQPSAKPVKRDVSKAYANTITCNGEVSLADSLPLHLKKVSLAVDPVFTLCEVAGPCALPVIDASLISGGLLRTELPADSPFFWQHQGAQALSAQVPDIEQRPGFIVLAAGTGSGKTAGGVRMLDTACRGQLRFTAALGLRSLTLQSGAAYVDEADMRLPRADVMTVVGDALYAKLNASEASAGVQASGSECLDEDEVVVTGGSEAHHSGVELGRALGLDSAQVLSLLATRKSVAMTQVPVLVCTVDHLMKAAAAQNGGDTRMTLRMATADLLLDEVDNYSPEDLVCLGRQVYLAGVHGRRVVLMSATVSETAIKALHDAWLQGLACFDLRREASSRHYLALICDKAPPVIVLEPSAPAAAQAVERFVTALIAATPAIAQKNRVGVFALGDDPVEVPNNIFAKALELAGVHFTSDAQGRQLSTGVVRFNQVGDAREFAKFLHQVALPQGVSLKVACYHRRMPLYHLSVMERTLNALLKRKQPQQVFESALIKQWMHNEPQAERFILIVCATSIQETGRDHDYDFAITEPWSTRSLVQLCGRVMRHRGGRAASPNVWVMDKPLSTFRPGSRNHVELAHVYKKGPLAELADIVAQPRRLPAECSLRRGQGFNQPAIAPALMQTLQALGILEAVVTVPLTLEGAYAFDLAALAEGVTAHHCLRAPPLSLAPLTALEHALQHARMHALGTWSLQRIVSAPKAPLFSGHHSAVRFRRQTAEQILLTFTPGSEFQTLALVQRDRFGVVLVPAKFELAQLSNLERALVRLDLLDPLLDERVPAEVRRNPRSLAAKLLYSFESYGDEETALAGNAVVNYHPLLGADKVRKAAKPS